MKLPRVGALTVSSSAMILALPNVEASRSDSRAPQVIETNESHDLWSPHDIESSNTQRVIDVPIVEHWDPGKNGRFRTLAKKEALSELTPEEAVELESLTQLRRQEHHPRSADEIIWHRRQQKLTRTLLEALKEYVEFHEGSRGS